MTLQGTLNSGIIVLDQPAPWPEGTRVEVLVQMAEQKNPILLDKLGKHARAVPDQDTDANVNSGDPETSANEPQPTLRGLLKFAGTLSDLPSDFAAEHDHYIHGTPKRSERAG